MSNKSSLHRKFFSAGKVKAIAFHEKNDGREGGLVSFP